MTRATAVSALFVSFFALDTAFGRLDYVDADGVTERGGSPEQSRMLPRTGPDGRLDASLLPPVGAYVASPDPSVAYVSAGAAPGGNGSAIAPFNGLDDALAAVGGYGNCVIRVAPGRYSCTRFDVAEGTSITLVGCGPCTVFESLSFTAGGGSPATEVCVVSAVAETVALDGGTVNLRLLGAKVVSLTGNASPVTVTRQDMGARVDVMPAGVLSAYEGFRSVPYAEAVTGSVARLVMTGTRPTVGDETCAFLSDVSTATGAVYVSIGGLDARCSSLASDLEAEASARASGDSAAADALAQATNTLHSEIAGVGSHWDDQMELVMQSVGSLASEYAALRTKETNDVANLEAEDARIRADYATADATQSATLRGEMSYSVSQLEGRVPGIADQRAESVLALARPGIVTEVRNAVSSDINALSASISTLNGTVSGHTVSISGINGDIGTIKDRINALIDFVKSKHSDCNVPKF